MAAQTLLTRIAWRLGAPERVATEALSHIAASYEAARRTLADTLRTAGVEGGPIVRVATQSVSDTGERPILAAFDDRGAGRAFIEAVFWGARATAYIEPPPHDRPAALLFVAPAARCETFWTGLCKDAAIASSAVSAGEEPWSAATSDGSRLVLISWKTLLGRMSGAAIAAGEKQAELDIRELREFASQQEETDFLPLRSNEIGPRLPRRLRSLRRLIDIAVARICDRGWKHKRSMSNRNGYYIELELSDATLRFGIHLELWKRHGTTPLWLIVHKPGSLTVDEARRRLESLLADVDGTPSVPIKLPVGVEEDKVLEDVVRQLEEIAHRIRQEPGSRP